MNTLTTTTQLEYSTGENAEQPPAPQETMPVADATDPMRCITREGDGCAWRVSVVRNSSENLYHRSFGDSRYRSKASALAAAQAWRDAMEAPPTQPRTRGRRTRRDKNDAPDTCGVYRVVSARWQGEVLKQLIMRWLAVTPPHISPRRQRSFSIFRSGEEGAYRLAVAARRKFEEEEEEAREKVRGRAREACPPALRHIRRVERKRFGIWYVSIDCERSGRVFRKPFSDLLYDSKACALVAAQTWRDEIERRHSPSPDDDLPQTIRAA